MLSLLSAMLCCVAVSAQHKVEMIPFGNMDQWIDRQIKESGIIGGATKNVYAIGPTATIRENKPYKNMGGSPWATSNVMARVAGITKNQYFGISGEAGRRLLCPYGHPYGKRKGVRHRGHYGAGCRFHIFGRCTRAHQGDEESAEDTEFGHPVHQETYCHSV